MLTGKQVRVKLAKSKLVPQYIKVNNPELLGVVSEFLNAYRASEGRTRGQLEDDLAEMLAEGPLQPLYQGLAKLLEDRCEFEAGTDLVPETVREAVFRLAALHQAQVAETGGVFNREGILHAAAAELGVPAEQVEQALFADLKGEARVLKFEDITPERLLMRYNVALVQSVLLRATRVEVRVWGETPARYRQLFRAVKFHRLIATVKSEPAASYRLALDGPMSLFSSTSKYGFQLAFFFPSLLHCGTFEMRAEVRWGAERKEKILTVTSSDGLKPVTPDFGTAKPREVELLLGGIAEDADWEADEEPSLVPVGQTVWVPDFTLTHKKSGRSIPVEVVGYWRKLDLVAHAKRLDAALKGRFLLVVGATHRTDEADDALEQAGVVWYKKTPLAGPVIGRAAEALETNKAGRRGPKPKD